MARKNPNQRDPDGGRLGLGASVEELMLAALDRGGDGFETGRYIATFREGAGEQGVRYLQERGLRVADARDTPDQAGGLETAGDADALYLAEIGVAVLSGSAVAEGGLEESPPPAEGPVEAIEPETFVFGQSAPGGGFGALDDGSTSASEYLRGFLSAAQTIARDLGGEVGGASEDVDVLALGATWGLNACRVPQSRHSGAGIRVAVLDTGMDLGHPDFAGRPMVSATFVGQPVQDLHSHGTHCIGTACGPRAPAGNTPRYGIAHRSAIHVGKVLSNSGSSVSGSVLSGMNWAIAKRCTVISMSLGGKGGPFAHYTAAGRSALNNGLLIVAAACNSREFTYAPANSPSIMSVASLNQQLQPSAFSNYGKIDIAAPGESVYSSIPRPRLYGYKSGTSMATPHVAGCAALWAESSPALRGQTLWNQLQRTARRLPYPASRVGAGLVQSP